MTTPARYDDIADWYASWVGDGDGLIADYADEILPSVRGAHVLDVACGQGRAARALARLGATVVGVDISAAMIDVARAGEDAATSGISYFVSDVTNVDGWWDGTLFDGAVCEMALMDIDDVHGTFAAVAATVRAGGWFVCSIVHPCFPGNAQGLSSWPPDQSYFAEGRWWSASANPDGVRIRVGSSHRTLSTYCNALADAGFVLDRLVEPPAPEPTLLLLRGRRTRH